MRRVERGLGVLRRGIQDGNAGQLLAVVKHVTLGRVVRAGGRAAVRRGGAGKGEAVLACKPHCFERSLCLRLRRRSTTGQSFQICQLAAEQKRYAEATAYMDVIFWRPGSCILWTATSAVAPSASLAPPTIEARVPSSRKRRSPPSAPPFRARAATAAPARRASPPHCFARFIFRLRTAKLQDGVQIGIGVWKAPAGTQQSEPRPPPLTMRRFAHTG